MTDKKPCLGDIIVSDNQRGGPEPTPSPSEMIAALAARFEVDPGELRAEVMGSGPLAHVFRSLFDIQRSKTPKGRRPDVERNWREFVYVRLLAKETGSVASAIETIVATGDQDDKDASAEATIQRRFSRSVRQWENAPFPENISGLFKPAPNGNLDK